MGRSSDEGGDEVERELFPNLPGSRKPNALISTIEESATWSVDKARLVEEYIRLYQLITYGGIFIDGFAAPQIQDESTDLWTVKRILEIEPKCIQRFFHCDFDDHGIQILRRLKQDHEATDEGSMSSTVTSTSRSIRSSPPGAFVPKPPALHSWISARQNAIGRRFRNSPTGDSSAESNCSASFLPDGEDA